MRSASPATERCTCWAADTAAARPRSPPTTRHRQTRFRQHCRRFSFCPLAFRRRRARSTSLSVRILQFRSGEKSKGDGTPLDSPRPRRRRTPPTRGALGSAGCAAGVRCAPRRCLGERIRDTQELQWTDRALDLDHHFGVAPGVCERLLEGVHGAQKRSSARISSTHSSVVFAFRADSTCPRTPPVLLRVQ